MPEMWPVLGGWMVEIDALPRYYETADEALDDWLDWVASGKRPHGIVIVSDPPEGLHSLRPT